jgi:hypothetical protein
VATIDDRNLAMIICACNASELIGLTEPDNAVGLSTRPIDPIFFASVTDTCHAWVTIGGRNPRDTVKRSTFSKNTCGMCTATGDADSLQRTACALHISFVGFIGTGNYGIVFEIYHVTLSFSSNLLNHPV